MNATHSLDDMLFEFEIDSEGIGGEGFMGCPVGNGEGGGVIGPGVAPSRPRFWERE
jgi:hypothetical protein